MKKIQKSVSEKIDKVTNLITEPIHQRISNPIISSFAISWVLINWQPVLFLIFSKKSIELKISNIFKSYYGTPYENLIMYLGLPLLFSLIYSFALPWLSDVVEFSNIKPIKRKKDRIHALNLLEYENQILYAEKENEIINVKANYLDIAKLNTKILLLTADADEKTAAYDLLSEKHNLIQKEKEDLQNELSSMINKETELIKIISNVENLKKILTENKNIINEFVFQELSYYLTDFEKNGVNRWPKTNRFSSEFSNIYQLKIFYEAEFDTVKFLNFIKKSLNDLNSPLINHQFIENYLLIDIFDDPDLIKKIEKLLKANYPKIKFTGKQIFIKG